MRIHDIGLKRAWQKPAYESLKFSETLGGYKDKWPESVTAGPHQGAIS